MNKRILITTPFPSLDDVARELGISKSHRKKIEDLVEGIIASDSSAHGLRIPRAVGSRRRGKDGTFDAALAHLVAREKKHGRTSVHALRKLLRRKG